MFRKTTIICVLPLLLAGVASAADPESEVARIRVDPGQIHWQPKVTSQAWTVTISGQGIYLRQRFEGEQPTVWLTTPDGELLADGSYNWELRAIRPATLDREALREERREEARTEEDGVEFERRLERRAVVSSGSFVVRHGAFVVPRPESAGGDDGDDGP